MSKFRNRWDAGRRLGRALSAYAGRDCLVLALPRGGVPVGYEVATALGAPLDVWIVRKVRVPWQRELGMGAVAEGGFVHLNEDVIDSVGLSREDVERAVEDTKREVTARIERYRGKHTSPTLRDKTVILLDDGIATGGTMHAALLAIRAARPDKIVLAVPVAAPDALASITSLVDDVVCLHMPKNLYSVGLWYADFAQVSDEEVVELLRRAQSERDAAHAVAP